MTTPILECPSCGPPLAALPTPPPGSAPFLCVYCVKGWWGSELTTSARGIYDPVLRCFPNGVKGEKVRADVGNEAADSHKKPRP